MGTFGTRPEDVVTDSRGNAASGVALTLYPTKADALAQTNTLGTATSVTGGSWPIDLAGREDAWARTPAGQVYPIQSDSPRASAVQFATLAPLGANIQATVRKLADAVSDVRILVLGDSTASNAGQWPDELMPDVQALYPHRTLYSNAWGGASYGAPVQVGPAGTGAGRIDYFAGAVTGTVPESLWATWDAQIAAVQPDLVIVHYGHNYGATAAGGGQPDNATMDYVFRERMLRFVAEIKRSAPRADILVNSQNPYLTAGTRTGISSIRAQAIREICADLGCAYGPVVEAFTATPDPTLYLGADLLHPNSAGANLIAAALLPQFRYQANVPVAARQPSPFLLPGRNLLTNGDFAAFAAPPVLTGWTASNATLAKDVTNYESANAYSVKGTGTAAANNSMYQLLPIRRVQGQLITFAARFFIAAAQASGSVGRVGLSGDGGLVAVNSGTLTNIRDRWVWAFVTTRVPAGATFATASIVFGGAVAHECSVDRAIAVVGHLPRDL